MDSYTEKISSKSKIYFPTSEDYQNFICITGSTNKIIFPIISGNKNRFHVTALAIQRSEEYIIDIHVKDQVDKKYFSVFQATITPQMLSNFAKKFESVALEIVPIISKYVVKKDEVPLKNLYCVDCAFEHKGLPNKLAKAGEYWKSLQEASERDILMANNCSIPIHKTFYDSHQKIMLYKLDNGTFLVQYDSESLFQELSNVYEKHFAAEIEIFGKIIQNVIKIIEEQETSA